jgi:hypothetical protein
VTAAEWGIPELDPALQATAIPAPAVRWGTAARGAAAGAGAGTIHFYGDDYKFTRLWHDTGRLLAAAPAVAVEANFSTHPGMARAEVLWGIYRKRTLARAWQAHGIRLVVDLDVEPAYRDLALLGVPRGWRAYATRVHRGIPLATIEGDYELAARHAGAGPVLFVVYGGGDAIPRHCAGRGWVWIPEHRQVVAGRVAPYGTGTGGR